MCNSAIIFEKNGFVEIYLYLAKLWAKIALKIQIIPYMGILSHFLANRAEINVLWELRRLLSIDITLFQ